MLTSRIKSALLLTALSFASTFANQASESLKDIPISQILNLANEQLTAGNHQDALAHFDSAILRDPENYLTIFKRGATYLSLGKPLQALHDFDKVLAIKPGFEGALLQRAKIRSRQGQWQSAKEDYKTAGKGGIKEMAELEEAEVASGLAKNSIKKKDWDSCISQASVAIAVASAAPELRDLRAKCRLERGEAIEAVSDLQHLSQLSSGSIEPYLQISALLFYSLGDTEKGLSQIRKCLQSDPDSKPCREMMKREKALQKRLKNLQATMEKRQFNAAVNLLTSKSKENGLLQDVLDDIQNYKDKGYINAHLPKILHETLLDKTCEAYIEVITYLN